MHFSQKYRNSFLMDGKVLKEFRACLITFRSVGKNFPLASTEKYLLMKNAMKHSHIKLYKILSDLENVNLIRAAELESGPFLSKIVGIGVAKEQADSDFSFFFGGGGC